MERLVDVYTVLAGDVSASYAGRGYNTRLGRFLTVSGTDNGTSRMTLNHIHFADVIVWSAAGAIKDGLKVGVFTCEDPTHPELSAPWFYGVLSKHSPVIWEGRRPLACGFFWRIHPGGLVAGDLVSIGVGYE